MDKKVDQTYDSLRGWREENHIGVDEKTPHYAGGSEYDATAEAIMEYEREQKLAEQKKAEQKKPEQKKEDQEMSL